MLFEMMQNLGLLPQGVFAEIPCGGKACWQAWRLVQEGEQGGCTELLGV